MLRDVSLTDPFRYDGFVAYEMWLNLLKGIVSIDLFITYIKRLVIVRINAKYAHLPLDVREDLMQTVLLEIWRQVDRRKLPVRASLPYAEQVLVWHQFLNTVIDRRTINAFFDEIYDDGPRRMTLREYDRPYLYRFPTVGQVEDRIFLQEELPNVIRNSVLEHIRFEDEGFRAAAAYVVSRVLSGRRIVRSRIKRDFGVSNYKFLIEHVLILIRAQLYETRGMLQDHQVYEGSPLEEFFQVHYGV